MTRFKIDIKTGFIIVLGLIIIFMILFKPSKRINSYENEIEKLNVLNKELLNRNDSLKHMNNVLENQIGVLETNVESVNNSLDNNRREIKRLKNKKGEIFNYVNSMDANGVTRGFSDYLKRRD